MVSVMNHVGPKKTSGFSIDSLLGIDVSKDRRSPSPVGSVSSNVSSENEPSSNVNPEVKQKPDCHEEFVEGCRSCNQNVLRDRLPEHSAAIPNCYGNKITTISSKHLPYLQNIGNGILSRFQGFPLTPIHSNVNLLAHTNHTNGHLSWLHQHHNGSPLNWPGRYGDHIDGRYSGSESSLMLPHFRKPKRLRTAFSPSQLLRLEHAFEKNHYVVGQERKDLASGLGLSETQVKVWFQNRRTKYKRMKVEEEMTRTIAKKMKPEHFQKIIYNNGIVSTHHSNMMSWHNKNIDNNIDAHSETESDEGA